MEYLRAFFHVCTNAFIPRPIDHLPFFRPEALARKIDPKLAGNPEDSVNKIRLLYFIQKLIACQISTMSCESNFSQSGEAEQVGLNPNCRMYSTLWPDSSIVGGLAIAVRYPNMVPSFWLFAIVSLTHSGWVWRVARSCVIVVESFMPLCSYMVPSDRELTALTYRDSAPTAVELCASRFLC